MNFSQHENCLIFVNNYKVRSTVKANEYKVMRILTKIRERLQNTTS